MNSGFGLPSDLPSVFSLDTQLVNRAFELLVTEEQLNGPEILGPSVDQCRQRQIPLEHMLRKFGLPRRADRNTMDTGKGLLQPRE